MAVRACYLIAREIAVASKPSSDGEFAKNCLMKSREIVRLEKRLSFANTGCPITFHTYEK